MHCWRAACPKYSTFSLSHEEYRKWKKKGGGGKSHTKVFTNKPYLKKSIFNVWYSCAPTNFKGYTLDLMHIWISFFLVVFLTIPIRSISATSKFPPLLDNKMPSGQSATHPIRAVFLCIGSDRCAPQPQCAYVKRYICQSTTCCYKSSTGCPGQRKNRELAAWCRLICRNWSLPSSTKNKQTPNKWLGESRMDGVLP